MTIIDRGDARPLQLKQKQPQQSEQQAAAAEADRLSAAAVVEAEQLSSWLLPPPALLLLAVACLLVGAGSPGTGHRVARPQHQAICIARRRGARMRACVVHAAHAHPPIDLIPHSRHHSKLCWGSRVVSGFFLS